MGARVVPGAASGVLSSDFHRRGHSGLSLFGGRGHNGEAAWMGSQSVIQNDANGAGRSGHTEADRSQVVRIKGVTMRRHFVSHRWVWLAIAITVVVANELVDRNFFDHREHSTATSS